jgi:hypothetical protein
MNLYFQWFDILLLDVHYFPADDASTETWSIKLYWSEALAEYN